MKKSNKQKNTKKSKKSAVLNPLTREEIMLENFLELVNETQFKISYNAFAQYGGGGGTGTHIPTGGGKDGSLIEECI